MEQVFETSLVELDKIKPSFFQTRTETYDEELEDLTKSIKKYGVLQPVVLRNIPDGYEVIAGDRRCRAARLAGLTMIRATVRDLSDEDALVLQATENLHRQGLSEPEKTRIVTELAKRCRLDAKGVAEKLGMSYPWVVKYLPSEFKNGDKAEAGKLGGLAKGSSYRAESAILNIADCEYCGVGTSEPKSWENHLLCPLYYSQALEDPARFKRFFGFQQQHPVIAELQKLQPLDTWEYRKTHMSPHDSEMQEYLVSCLHEKGYGPIITNRKHCLLETEPDVEVQVHGKWLQFYLDLEVLHVKREERDEQVRSMLERREGSRTITLKYTNKSQETKNRLLAEIVKELEG